MFRRHLVVRHFFCFIVVILHLNILFCEYLSTLQIKNPKKVNMSDVLHTYCIITPTLFTNLNSSFEQRHVSPRHVSCRAVVCRAVVRNSYIIFIKSEHYYYPTFFLWFFAFLLVFLSFHFYSSCAYVCHPWEILDH